ncbi:MAG: Coq4 family protein [Novosphingobium sp.]|nr:Coq4 family protein [Novosphingobium sp.]
MQTQAQVGEGERAYFNGGMRKIETNSSTLVSSSKYLNHPELRALIAQEMLRRNGADLPNTAYIPEVVQILQNLEDFPAIMRLFEEEKARLPEFREWLENRNLSNFKLTDVEDCAPGTLGARLHRWMVESGYELDLFYPEIEVVKDFTFYLRQSSLTHDIEHMISGFGPNHGGEIALVNANLHSRVRYFRPELACYFNRVQTYLKAKTIMKDGLHYPEASVLNLEAEYLGAEQGRNWKIPLMIVDWRKYVDWKIEDIREELGIFPVIPEGAWDDTNKLCDEGHADYAQPAMMAAAE